MRLYQIVLKDMLRRKRRVLYTAIGIVISTMTVIGTLTVSLAGETKIILQLEKYGPNLTIMPAISSRDLTLGSLSLGTVTVGENFISQDTLPKIREITDRLIKEALGANKIEALGFDYEASIAIVAPRLYVASEIKGTPVTLVGIDPAEEFAMRTWWKVEKGRYLGKGWGGKEILTGALVSEFLKLGAGDTIALNGNDFTVVGVLDETGSREDNELFVPLEALQEAFGKRGIISSVDVRALCNACPVELIAAAINETIPGVRAVAVKQVAQTERGMLERVNRFMLALAGITLVIGCFGVANTMMTSVHERIRDIGIMRATGASKKQILMVFLEEAVVVGIIGGILGFLSGNLLASVAGPMILEGTPITFVLSYLPLSVVFAIAIAVTAAIYPAFQATRIKVADSFRAL